MRQCAVVLAVLTCSACWAGSEAVDNEGPNVGEAAKAEPDEQMAYLSTSADLAVIARANQDAILMLAAARLETMAGARAEPKDKTVRGEAQTGTGEKAEAAGLYALAEEYAGSNDELLALVEDGKDEVTSRGSLSGPGWHSDRVLAGYTDIYNLAFRGGQFAEVAVSGDGDTDLDLHVYDEHGNAVCSDTDYTDQTYCGWRPRWSGTFRIEIENLGNVYNAYDLYNN